MLHSATRQFLFHRREQIFYWPKSTQNELRLPMMFTWFFSMLILGKRLLRADRAPSLTFDPPGVIFGSNWILIFTSFDEVVIKYDSWLSWSIKWLFAHVMSADVVYSDTWTALMASLIVNKSRRFIEKNRTAHPNPFARRPCLLKVQLHPSDCFITEISSNWLFLLSVSICYVRHRDEEGWSESKIIFHSK